MIGILILSMFLISGCAEKKTGASIEDSELVKGIVRGQIPSNLGVTCLDTIQAKIYEKYLDKSSFWTGGYNRYYPNE